MVHGLCLCLLLATQSGAQTAPGHGGRYDRQILTDIQKIIADKNEFKKIHAEVEDGIVKFTGTVKLESSRVWLERRVKSIAHVHGVNSEVVLDPPALPDQELTGRVRRNLSDAGFENLRFTAHNGAVVLSGVVRSQKERRRVLQIVRSIPGVKEAESRLTVAYEN